MKPVFDLNDPVLPSHNRNVAQATYGTSRYDDRSDELIVMTTEYKASGHYRYNWTHFVDARTGEIKKTIDLEPYYWFQSMPIFPDKEDARLDEDFNGIIMGVDKLSTMPNATTTLNLRTLVNDPDNNDNAIVFTLPEANTETEGDDIKLNLTLDNHRLTINPTDYGHGTALVNAISNGRTVTLSIPVTVEKNMPDEPDPSGIDGVNARSIRLVGNRLLIKGYVDSSFSLFDATGLELNRFTVDTDEFWAAFNLKPGVYVLRGANTSYKFMVR